jgi:Mannosyltransferase (PIG-V)
MSDRPSPAPPQPFQPPPLPGWARAADVAAMLLIIVAITSAISGGLRMRIGSWHVSLTSPFRVLMWAAAIIIVRHLIARQEPLYRRAVAELAAWRRSPALRTAAIVVIGTRPAMFIAGYLAVVMFGYPPGTQPFHDFDNELLNLPLKWDTGWYLSIATDGYRYVDQGGADIQQNIVFFPGYPLMVRAVAELCGNGRTAYVVGGTLVSLVLFLVALGYLFRLAREAMTDDQAAASVWLLAAYPFALFYGAIYSESLYLAGVLGAFYHFRQRQFARAATWGWIVGLTRPNGFLVCVPLAIMAIERWRPWRRLAPARSDPPAPGPPNPPGPLTPASLAAVAMPAVGMLTYSVFVFGLTGNPLAWLAGHAAWGRHYQGLPGLTHLVADRYGFIAHAGLLKYASERPYDALNGCAAAFVILAAWPVARRFGLAYAAFILINMLPPLAAGGLLSAGRFSAITFPVFLWLAAAIPARHRPGWIVTFAALQAFNAALFYTWRPLY